MKRANNLIDKMIEPDNLRLAYWKAQKGKRGSKKVANYHGNWQQNLILLRNQIMTGKVNIGDYYFFTIFDPKEREICAPSFAEQVLHHALMNVCHPFFEKKQIFDSYASRKNKGTYAALERAKKYTRIYPHYLKLDVRKYFASIHHNILILQLQPMFREKKLLSIFTQIIQSFNRAKGQGLPIGTLTSQYFANHYLSGLDHFIKERLRCKAYVRYMDDMILWHDTKKELRAMDIEIQSFVSGKLQLQLKPIQLNQCKRGLPFLGYRLFPDYLRLSSRASRRYIKKLAQIEANLSNGIWNEDICQQHYLPLLAFTQHANAKNFRKNVISKLKGNSL